MQQKIQAGWQWFQRASRFMQVCVAVGVLVVACSLCAGLGAALGSGGTSTSSVVSTNMATATPKPTLIPQTTTMPKPTSTPQAIHYPPIIKADLRELAANGDASAIHEFHSEAAGLVGVCPEPKREVLIDPSVTGQQLAEDLLAYFYDQNLDSPCGSLVLAYHSQSEAGDVYTAGRINFDVTGSSGQGNIDPNGTNLKYTLTLNIGNALSSQEYIVMY